MGEGKRLGRPAHRRLAWAVVVVATVVAVLTVGRGGRLANGKIHGIAEAVAAKLYRVNSDTQ